METPHDLDQAMLKPENLGKCTKPHDDLGPEFDRCPLLDNKNPNKKFCGACGCHMRFHAKPNLDSSDPKHKVFLSHSGKQKDFVEQLCLDLERFDRYVFFDKDQYSLPIGENFPRLIFRAIHQCHVGVVIVSDEFFASKWTMMELAAMVDEVMKRESSFKIIPVFLHSLLDDIRDGSSKFIEWKSLWEKWALENPERINVKKWEAALKYLCPINGLKSIIYEKLGEVQFRKVIVDAICIAVPPEVKFEVSHVQGSSRLCEVIKGKIIDVQGNCKSNGACVMGLYGVGGIGKTSICKVLYNQFFTKFQGRVCHAELERRSEEELLRDVVERLTETNPKKLLDGRKFDELHDLLKRGIEKHPVFLALDNLSDESMQEAERYLSLNLLSESIVIVTARSLGLLRRLGIDESNCLEMPELEMEEAMSLFAKSSKFDLRDEVYKNIIVRCVKRCHFWKDDGSDNCHYHPLALDVLGRQLKSIDAKKCERILDKINDDIFNRSSENTHPIFSILRTSYDTLTPESKLLFMDVALFLPQYYYGINLNVFEWLGMVHGLASIDDVIDKLELLMRKSLLERIGDGIEMRIGMHDLWRGFCVAEIEHGELGCRRWVCESEKQSKLVETTPSGIWQSVERMTLRRLERANFSHFPNVTVLKLLGRPSQQLVLDLSKLIRLKSLEVSGDFPSRLALQGLPTNLIFLSLMRASQQLIEQTECLKELQYLRLIEFEGSKLPDMRRMFSLRVANFCNCRRVDTLTGLSSNLRVLDLGGCEQLHDCPGVGDLVHLEKLNCRSCRRLERLPNLKKLRNLQKLDISGCPFISEVSGLGDLVALEDLNATVDESTLLKLPNMRNLTNLQALHLGNRCLVAVLGFDSLFSLLEVVADFQAVVERPNLQQLTKMMKLEINGWSLAGLRGLNNLAMLHTLGIHYSSGVDELPDCQGMISLQTLSISECEFKDVSGLSNLSALEKLLITRCKMLERVSDLQGLTRLKSLKIMDCAVLRGWDCTLEQVEGSSCKLDDSNEGDLSDSKRLTSFQSLILSPCGVTGVMSMRAFAQLERLECESLPLLRELPDLSNFPGLKNLKLKCCKSLTRLTSCEPISVLSELQLSSCSILTTLPDLNMFPALSLLGLNGCWRLTVLSSSVSLTALRKLNLQGCRDLKALPDLGMFPALSLLNLYGCSGLMALSCSATLTALSEVKLRGCTGLKALPDLGMFEALRNLDLRGCSRLTALSCSVPLTALSKLNLQDCRGLKALPDLGMLKALPSLDLHECSWLTALSCSMPLTAFSKLYLQDCRGLKALPDLGMFPALLDLNLYGCSWLMALSCSVPLTALSKLNLQGCRGLKALPDLGMFGTLPSLDLHGCRELMALSCSVPSTSLWRLNLQGCIGLKALPNLEMFPKLRVLSLNGCSKLPALSCNVPMAALVDLKLQGCSVLKALPDLGMFLRLPVLDLEGCWGLTTLSSNVPLTTLSKLILRGCRGLNALPDLGMFEALWILDLYGCSGLKALSSSVPLTALSKLNLQGCSGMTALPDLGMLPALPNLHLDGCSGLTALSSSMPLTALHTLILHGGRGLNALPDLGMFEALQILDLHKCHKLTALSSSVPLTELHRLKLQGCSGITALPNLGMFLALRTIRLDGCSKLTALSSSVPLSALSELKLQGCSDMTALPDLGMFSALQTLHLDGCSKITALSSSVPLSALSELKLQGCSGMTALPDLGMFQRLRILDLDGCSRLTALGCSATLISLRQLNLDGCIGLRALPDLQKFPLLKVLTPLTLLGKRRLGV